MAAIDILLRLPKEDLKALSTAGVLRRNVTRESQAVTQYLKLRSESDIKAVDACEQIAKAHGMSQRTLFRIIKTYTE